MFKLLLVIKVVIPIDVCSLLPLSVLHPRENLNEPQRRESNEFE